MSKEKQIEEMSAEIREAVNGCSSYWSGLIAEHLYEQGYRKQSEGKWVNNHCSVCGMTPIGEETWERHGDTPPRFELFMDYCPTCGAKMKGGTE